MLSIEERVAIVSVRLRGLSYQQVQQSFEWKFRKSAPTRANIQLLVNKLKRTGSVLDEKRWGRPQISEDNTRRIQQAAEQGPCASIHHLSNQLDIPRTTVWRVLHFKFMKRAYHLQVRDYLNNTFRNTWIGRAAPKHWASCSPDLTPLHFLAWGFINPSVRFHVHATLVFKWFYLRFDVHLTSSCRLNFEGP
jgi:transposase